MHTPATEPIAIPAFAPTERPVSVPAAVETAEAEEEDVALAAVCEIAADGDVDGASDPVVKEAVDKGALLGALVGDGRSAFEADDIMLDAVSCDLICGSWLVGLFGVVFCVTTRMLVLVAIAVDVVGGA